jgi:hypothetical protein
VVAPSIFALRYPPLEEHERHRVSRTGGRIVGITLDHPGDPEPTDFRGQITVTAVYARFIASIDACSRARVVAVAAARGRQVVDISCSRGRETIASAV